MRTRKLAPADAVERWDKATAAGALPQVRFQLLIIDEAGQAGQAEVMLPLVNFDPPALLERIRSSINKLTNCTVRDSLRLAGSRRANQQDRHPICSVNCFNAGFDCCLPDRSSGCDHLMMMW